MVIMIVGTIKVTTTEIHVEIESVRLLLVTDYSHMSET